MRAARKEIGLSTSQTVMIGDTMETDILGGIQMGYRTILVLSGGTRREDLARYAFQPDLVVDSIADLLNTRDIARTLPLPRPEEDSVDLDEWRLERRAAAP